MPPLKKKRKKKSKIYFGTPVHDAIIRYNHSDIPSERNTIYTEEIHKAFLKLAENIINTFKFSYFSYGFRDLQEEVVSNLVINMHKFDETKGSKAFSYFSVVAKNYLILNNNANYKKVKIHDDVDTLYTHGIDDEMIEKNPSSDIFKKTMEYFEANVERLFPKPQDREIAESILYLCKNKDNIDNFNKKAIYIMIREMTNSNTQHITRVVNVMKKHHVNLQYNYLTTGSIETKFTGSWDNL